MTLASSVELVRDLTAERINAVINHEAVKPTATPIGTGTVDLTASLQNEQCLALMLPDGTGGFVFENLGAGVHEAYAQFLPVSRGAVALQAAREAVEWMFTRTDATEVITKCPAHVPGARRLARRLGAVFQFRRDDLWPTEGGNVAVDFYGLRCLDWVRSSPTMRAVGEWFDASVRAERGRVGTPHVEHQGDLARDHYVGAAVAMMLSGQVQKGCFFFNRWARIAGYAPIALVSEAPLIVDFEGTRLQLEAPGNLRIVKCPAAS